MSVFSRIIIVAALAGLVAGIFVTAAHHFGTAAIIARAEVFEKAADAPAPAATGGATSTDTSSAGMAGMSHADESAAWEPKNGFERTAFTVLADVLTGVGFALLLASAFVISGREIDWRKGLFWGLAGFITFTLAPGLGLPPEVPGTASAPLLDRQIWWVATAVATAAGLSLLFLTQRISLALAGLALLVLPHIFGAPQPAEYKSAAPELLAHQFVVAAVITSLLFWAVLGTLTGFLYKRFQPAA
jgi:cobalt transporter subunit CbtA